MGILPLDFFDQLSTDPSSLSSYPPLQPGGVLLTEFRDFRPHRLEAGKPALKVSRLLLRVPGPILTQDLIVGATPAAEATQPEQKPPPTTRRR